jgi:hypothetical protein
VLQVTPCIEHTNQEYCSHLGRARAPAGAGPGAQQERSIAWQRFLRLCASGLLWTMMANAWYRVYLFSELTSRIWVMPDGKDEPDVWHVMDDCRRVND